MRLHDGEVDVDVDILRALLGAQFPEWSDHDISRVASSGTDNAIFRLGDELAVRMPRVRRAVHQIGKEHRWLPRLAPHLPAPLPEPVAKGGPGDRYPFPWLVYRWLSGRDALAAPVDDWNSLARQVAAFVVALQRIDTTGGPPAHSRVGPLAPHDGSTRDAIAKVADLVDPGRATAVWEAALSAEPWHREPVWVHGDLFPSNILVRDGQLAGVIDWSSASIGDPACEAMFAWSLPRDARETFRGALDIDDATWARGRGWALQQAALYIPYYAETIPDAVAAARIRLRAVVDDDVGR